MAAQVLFDQVDRPPFEDADAGKKVLEAKWVYEDTAVHRLPGGRVTVEPQSTEYVLRTQNINPDTYKVGVMLVGWGGNNGTTVTACTLANKYGIEWENQRGKRKADYLGSLTQAATTRLGFDPETNEEIYVQLKDLVPMASPNQFVFGGWDISSLTLDKSMDRAKVLDLDLKRNLRAHPEIAKVLAQQPLPGLYYPDFIAANQDERADHILNGDKNGRPVETRKMKDMEKIRTDIREFKAKHKLDKVIVLWTANTERFCTVTPGVHDTADNLMASIGSNHPEISPSTVFAVASILEGCPYINGSPQNTFVPGCIELAERHAVLIGGDDFKSGQTKFKSVMVDFLVSAGIKPVSIASYNHLGNNDGKNLSAPAQFRSKEISKSNVVDDMVGSNRYMYADPHGDKPDHTVVIKYMPYVGDSKRAMDEYVSEIFMGGLNTIAAHNTCEDSLLASPLIIDLVVLSELGTRVSMAKKSTDGVEIPQRFHAVFSFLSYLLKAPITKPGTPVINSLFKQHEALTNFFRALRGLPVENHMLLQHRLSESVATPVPRPEIGHEIAASQKHTAVVSEVNTRPVLA